MPEMLFIFSILLFLPILSSAATVPASNNTLFNCYKFEKVFPDVNFIDSPVEEKSVVKCDQCFSYLCHSKNEEYVLGNGCREDFFNNCNIDSDVQDTFKSDYNNLEECGVVEDYNSISDFCLKDYCNHNRMRSCISKVINISPNEPIGPAHKAINITFIQRTTPAPTTSIPTTSIPTIQSPNNPIDNDGSQNGNDDKDSQSNASTNSKILSMLFFGNFVFAYFM